MLGPVDRKQASELTSRRSYVLRLHVSGLTVAAEHQRSGRTLDPGLGDGVGHHAGVVADVRGLHLGDVQVPRLLRDEAAGVLLHERRVLVKDPGKYEICGWKKN